LFESTAPTTIATTKAAKPRNLYKKFETDSFEAIKSPFVIIAQMNIFLQNTKLKTINSTFFDFCCVV
jgi:hypothetical protein